MASENPFKIKKLRYNVSEDEATGILKKKFVPEKKGREVKFTWKGLANFAHIFDTNIFSPSRQNRIKELIDGKAKPREKDYIDFFEDLEKGWYSGAQKLGYAIGDTLTTGIDLAAAADITLAGKKIKKGRETELTEKLTDAYNDNKTADPETLLGKLTEILTQYGVTGGAAFSILNRAKRLAGIQKLRLGTRALAGERISNIASKAGHLASTFAITDYLSTEPDRGNLFMKEEETSNLRGSELAAARFKNRLRYGAEGAAIGTLWSLMGAPAAWGLKWGLYKPAMFAGGIGLKTANTVVVKPASWLLSKDPYVIPAISRNLQKGTNFTLQRLVAPVLVGRKPLTKLPEFSEWRKFSPKDANPLKGRLKKLDDYLFWFRSVGKMTGNRFNLTKRAEREIKARSRTIEKYLESLDYKATLLAKSFQKLHNTKTTSPASKEHYLDQVLSYLKNEKGLKSLPEELQTMSKGLNEHLMKIKQSFGELLPKSDLKNYILGNVRNYMRKSFSVFNNPEFNPAKEIVSDAVGYMAKNVVSRNKDMRMAAINEFKNMTPARAIEEHSKTMVTKILRSGKTDGQDPLQVLKHIAKHDLRSDKLIRTGEELPTAIKRLLGEEDNLKASVLFTTNHAIVQTTNKLLADRLAALGLKEGWLFKDRAAANAKGILDAEKISHLPDLGYLGSKLDKLFASRQISQAFRGTPGVLDTAIQNNAYRALLQLKVATQFGKTVLSPATQVRNVTSASLFPLASGHIGGRASVTEAIKMVADDIFGAGKAIDEETLIRNIENKIRLGVLDENIVASELGAVLKDIKKGSINTIDGLYNKLTNGKFMKTATRVYAGGDNIWKWYGHEYVKSQLRHIYKNVDGIAKWTKEITGNDYIQRDLITGLKKNYGDAIDEAAAWYIRNTYPTYSKVPEAIKAIRKLPFGNFVSFPAEMMRTSFNLINIGAKEISSSNELLRQIGYRRMLGTYTVLGGAGTAALNLASALTGVSLDELDAYKRSFAAPWNKNSILLPMDKWVKGVGKAINFSYFSPYDVVQRPVEAFMAQLQKGRMSNQEIDDLTISLFAKSAGELFDSFVAEPLGYERIIDVLPRGKFGRGGQKKAGGYVYSDTDEPSEIMYKSFVHFLEGIEPGISTTGRKIKSAMEGDVKPGGEPYSLRDEALALFSGIRVINVNVPKSLEYNITDYQQDKRAVTKTEKFYSLENAMDRGPSVLVNEFRDIQEEAFRVQQNFYYVIQDALATGLTKGDLRKIMKARRMGKKEIARLFRGKFTPFQYSKPLMTKRYKEAKKAYPDETIERSYFYPRVELNRVIREYKNKSLKYPEEREDRSTIVPEQKVRTASTMPDIDFSMPTRTRVQAPPLPQTPQPQRMGLASLQQINPATQLTQTESALLSPSEQIIKQRQRGTTT
jgi:hypothetical protein